MQTLDPIDDSMINAFVDAQLDAELRQAVIEAMEIDPDVRERVRLARRARDLFRAGYSNAEPPSHSREPARPAATGGHRASPAAVAALLLVAVALGSGVAGYSIARQSSGEALLAALASAQRPAPDRVILHVGHSDTRQFSAALRYVEHFLEQSRGPERRIEVIANSDGLDLMRSDISPYRARIAAMLHAHDNVHFIACANGIRNLRRRGIVAEFPDEVQTDRTAIDHIVDRLRAGWTYVKVDDLSELET
jgi:intracellular sulfur oxidation DsrE/DsrF family protein